MASHSRAEVVWTILLTFLISATSANSTQTQSTPVYNNTAATSTEDAFPAEALEAVDDDDILTARHQFIIPVKSSFGDFVLVDWSRYACKIFAFCPSAGPFGIYLSGFRSCAGAAYVSHPAIFVAIVVIAIVVVVFLMHRPP